MLALCCICFICALSGHHVPSNLGLAYVLLVETNPFSERVVVFPDYALRTSLGTFLISLVIVVHIVFTKIVSNKAIYSRKLMFLHVFDLTIPLLFQNGLPSVDNPYIFNGDFVDRGRNSTEIAILLFSCFLINRNEVYLNRGNHEDHVMNMR